MGAVSYSRESDMIQPIVRLGKELAGSGGTDIFAFTECVGNPGVADVVFVEFDLEAIEMRHRHGIPPLTSTVEMRVMYSLERDTPRDLDAIAAISGFSAGYIRSKVIKPLVEVGAIIKRDSGYTRSEFFAPVASWIIGVEAKLANWTRGLYQARRYLRFSDQVYLAVDKAVSKRVIPHSQTMRKQGVGLILVDSETDCAQIISKPKTKGPLSSADHALVGERLWFVAKNQNSCPQNFASMDSWDSEVAELL